MEKTLLFISKLPKTSISTIIWALITYWLSRGYIDWDTAMLISSIMVWLWISINIGTNNGKIQDLDHKKE